MVKYSCRRTSKRRPRKTAKKRIRKTKYSYKKNKQSGGGKIDKIWEKIKENSAFKELQSHYTNFPNLKQMKYLAQLFSANQIDKLADEIMKIRLKSSESSLDSVASRGGGEKEITKSDVILIIEHVKSLSPAERLKRLSKYFPGILKYFPRIPKLISGKKSSSRRSTKISTMNGGADFGMIAIAIGIMSLLLILMFWDSIREGRRVARREAEYVHPIDNLTLGKSTEPCINKEECPICLKGFEDGQDIATTPCRHCFHKDCINTWVVGFKKNTCPLCKHNLTELKPEPEPEPEDSIPRIGSLLGP